MEDNFKYDEKVTQNLTKIYKDVLTNLGEDPDRKSVV